MNNPQHIFEDKNQSILKKLKLKFINFFTEHPGSNGETYLEHLFVALTFSFNLFFSSLALLIHAFIPIFFKKTASTQIKKMYGVMVGRK